MRGHADGVIGKRDSIADCRPTHPWWLPAGPEQAGDGLRRCEQDKTGRGLRAQEPPWLAEMP